MKTAPISAVWIALVVAPLSACASAPDTTGSTQVAPPDPAAVTEGAKRTPVQMDTDYTIPGGALCDFPIYVHVVSNDEYQQVTTLADGTTITKIRGNVVISLTNTSNGVNLVRNVSGPTDETDYPDGTGNFIGEGLNWWRFGPHSRANTGEPGLVFTSGRVEIQFTGNIVTSFHLDGRQENGCELLSE
jgi:hypothetical protein